MWGISSIASLWEVWNLPGWQWNWWCICMLRWLCGSIKSVGCFKSWGAVLLTVVLKSPHGFSNVLLFYFMFHLSAFLAALQSILSPLSAFSWNHKKSFAFICPITMRLLPRCWVNTQQPKERNECLVCSGSLAWKKKKPFLHSRKFKLYMKKVK